MNAPSRTMPPRAIPKKPGVWAWFFMAAFAAAVAWLIYSNAGARWAAGALAGYGTVATLLSRRHFARLKAERNEASIGVFARALPARAHDTWVVRAVFEELSALVRVSVRPDDDLKKDLKIDPEDLDDAAIEIARRAGRSMDDAKKNPMADRVVTVADLILFFEHQPKLANQQPAECTVPNRRDSL